MRVSVILSTYNQPRWLEKSLWGYAAQSYRDFELIVADDGSGPDTAALVARVRAETGLDIEHVWHEDRGFRKCEILNRAILAASTDYLVFSDGDCIPREDFLATHVRLARPGYFLSGTAQRLPMEASERIGLDDIRAKRLSNGRWLRAQGYRPRLLSTKLLVAPRLNALADLVTTLPARFDANNVSTWKDGCMAVNGFDHEMVYGLEDRGLGLRLLHHGYRGRNIRNRAIVFHLDHDRPYATAEGIRRNTEIIGRIMKHREVRARVGLEELAAQLASGEGPTTVRPASRHLPTPSGADVD